MFIAKKAKKMTDVEKRKIDNNKRIEFQKQFEKVMEYIQNEIENAIAHREYSVRIQRKVNWNHDVFRAVLVELGNLKFKVEVDKFHKDIMSSFYRLPQNSYSPIYTISWR